MVLCDLEGLTRDQAAERLCWTEGTVRGRLGRARTLLPRTADQARGRNPRRGAIGRGRGERDGLGGGPGHRAVACRRGPHRDEPGRRRDGRRAHAQGDPVVPPVAVEEGFRRSGSRPSPSPVPRPSCSSSWSSWAHRSSAKQLAERRLPFREDLPIEGRVVGLEGQPVPGAVVKVISIYAPQSGDLTRWLQALKAKEADIYTIRDRYLRQVVEVDGKFEMLDPALVQPATTDARGEFRLTGIGREHLAELSIEAPGIRSTTVKVMTRREEALQVREDPHRSGENNVTFHGASIRLAVAPSRPVEGIVRDRATGTPIAGATVSTTRSPTKASRPPRSARPATPRAATGSPACLVARATGCRQPLPPNSLTCRSSRRSRYLQVSVRSATTWRVTRGVTIEGRVTGKSGAAYVCYHAAADNPELDSAPGFRLTSHGDYPPGPGPIPTAPTGSSGYQVGACSWWKRWITSPQVWIEARPRSSRGTFAKRDTGSTMPPPGSTCPGGSSRSTRTCRSTRAGRSRGQ